MIHFMSGLDNMIVFQKYVLVRKFMPLLKQLAGATKDVNAPKQQKENKSKKDGGCKFTHTLWWIQYLDKT